MVKCGGRLLNSTGLDNVLEVAIFPAFNYLPPLIPQHESVAILKPAYDAILTLIDLLKPENPSRSMRLLERTLRDGVIPGCHHTGDHPQLLRVLMDTSCRLVGQAGIRATKYLKVLMKDQIEPSYQVIPDPTYCYT